MILGTVCVEGDFTLLAHEHRLQVPVAVQGALAAVAALGPVAFVRADDPVLQAIKPQVGRDLADPFLDGRTAVCGKHLDHQLPHEVEEGALLAGDGLAQPPGIDGADADAPRVERKPPLLDSVWDPVRKKYKI